MESIEKPGICPICKQGKELKLVLKNKGLYECTTCNVQFFWGAKNPGASWYEETSDYGIKDILAPKIYRGSHKKLLEQYKQFKPGTTVLELGCGSGEVIAELQKRGCQVFGVDFDRKGIEVAKKHFGLQDVFAESLEVFSQRTNLPKFDFVLAFEVIEHVQDPLQFIQDAKKLLKPGGRIIISTPSRGRVFPNWNAWDFPPHHLTRWNKQSIERLSNLAQMKLVEFCYVEQYKLVAGAIDGKMRSGLVNKAAGQALENKKSLLLAKLLYIAAKVKYYVVAGIPAVFVWIVSSLMGYKNGIMYAELQ